MSSKHPTPQPSTRPTSTEKGTNNRGKTRDEEWDGKLTYEFIRDVRQPGYYSDSEVGGLSLRAGLMKCGVVSKSWVLGIDIEEDTPNQQLEDPVERYTHLGLGSWPAVTHAEAKRRAWAAKDEIAAGRDPRRRPKVHKAGGLVVDERSGAWRSPGTRKRWEHNLATHVYPSIGNMNVTAVRSVHIMAIVQPLAMKHPETAYQVLSHLRGIFAKVRAMNLRGDNPAEVAAAALGPVLRRRHRPVPALPYDQVPALLRQVESTRALWATKAVCAMMAHTGARQGEIRGLRSEEVDFDQAVATVPGERTKSGRVHRIPLSQAVLVLLEDARRRAGGVGLLFPSRTGRPISAGTLSRLFRQHHVGCVPHGLRASVRTFMSEQGIPYEVGELALGHTVKSLPAHDDLLEERRPVMEQWSQCLTEGTLSKRPDATP
jgi:integrase